MQKASLVKTARITGLGVAVAIALAAGAVAQPGPGFGWRYGPKFHGYYSGQEVARDKIETAVKAALAKAQKGTAWSSPRGIKHIPITVDNQIVGNLWQDEDLTKLEVGSYWAGPFGQHVDLVSGGRVVGGIWVKI